MQAAVHAQYEKIDLERQYARLKRARHVRLGELMFTHFDAMRALGLYDPPGQFLGEGSFGAAYELNHGDESSVLKFTRDPTEARASVALQGKTLKRVVPIYKVWRFDGTAPERGMLPWYLVHRAYLEELNEKEESYVETLFTVWNRSERGELEIPPANDTPMIAKWRSQVEYEVLKSARGLSRTQAAKLVEKTMAMLTEVSAAVHDFRAAGFEWEDIQSDNMMREVAAPNEKGSLMIGDVGWAEMNDLNVSPPPVFTLEEAKTYVARLRKRR